MLKIDLLPRQIAIARTNKILIALIIVLLLVEVGALGAVLLGVKARQGEVATELEEQTRIANEVEGLEREIGQKEGELKPIQDKIDFIAAADTCGEQYWDRFHAINEYIYERAQMTRFSITMPNSVNFTVIVGDTTEAARFVLNLVHCPTLSNISVSGLPAGVSIEGAGRGLAGGFQPMGGPEEMGMDEPGMMGEMGGGPAPAASATGEITLNVTATLVEGVEEPAPGGAGGPGPGMPPGMDPGMMDPGMMEDMGEPPVE